MAASRHDPPEAHDDEGRARRGFLRKLGIGGASVVTGLVAGAGAVGAAPGAPPKRSTRLVRPTPTKGADLATTRALRLNRIPNPPRSAAIGEMAQLRLPPTRRIQPSSREAVLRSLHGKLRLPSALQARSGEGGDVPTLPSEMLGQMTRLHSLASAYVEGILLTPTGCEYSGGVYGGAAPITYDTQSGTINPSILERRRLLVTAETRLNDRGDRSILWRIQTPGQPSERLAYTLEMHITPIRPDHDFDAHPVAFQLNGEPLSLLRTRTGALLAAVEMGGTTGVSRHRLQPTGDTWWGDVAPGFEFHWLKIIAV